MIEMIKNFVIGVVAMALFAIPIMALFAIPMLGTIFISILLGGCMVFMLGMFGYVVREVITEFSKENKNEDTDQDSA